MPSTDDTRDTPEPRTASQHTTPARTRTYDPSQTVEASAASEPVEETEVGAIPGYEIIEEIGHGGMGVVYRARQLGLNREVAIKTLLRGDLPRAVLARFWAEAEVMAALKHPHVVQVFELGESAGRPFMAMELVAGGSLADHLSASGKSTDSGCMPPRPAAELLEKIVRGVAAAHDLDIVHRDLKPANVLLDADGSPKVADFGIAKRQFADLTRTQTLMGTPAYMAPEQAAGRAKFVGPPADVWALGVILYECIAGKRPFDADTAEVLLSQIQLAEPTALKTQVPGLPRDLDTIISKCLAKEPENRYPTATELADELGRFLRGEPIAARPVGAAERLMRWVRRKPTAAAAYGLSALAVVLALVVFVIGGFWREAEGARGVAEGAKADAETARDGETKARLRVEGLLGTETQLRGELQQTNGKLESALKGEQAARGDLQTANGKLEDALKGEQAAKKEVERGREKIARINYGRTLQVAYQAWKDNKLAEARALLASTRPDLRGWEYDYVHRLCHSDVLTFTAHTFGARSGSFSTDGSKVITGGNDHIARIWDAATGKVFLELKGHKGPINSVAFSPDESKVATAGEDRTTRIWDAASGKQLLELKTPLASATFVSFSPDGSKVVTAADDHIGRIWDAASGKLLVELKGHAGWIHSASFNRDGSKVLTGGDGTARIWDAATGKQLLELKEPTARLVRTAAFSPDESKIVTGSWENSAYIFDAATGKLLIELQGHTGRVVSATFSPDGSKIATAGWDSTVRLWDAKTGKPLLQLKGHTGYVDFASWSLDGTKVITGGNDNVRIWDATRKDIVELKEHPANVTSGTFSPDGSQVVITNGNSPPRVWDPATGKRVFDLTGRVGATETVWFNRAGARIVSGTPKYPAIWDAATGQILRERWGTTVLIGNESFTPDGSKYLGLDLGPTAWIRDAETDQVLLGLRAKDRLSAAVFSPDGTRVATTSDDKTVRTWDSVTGKQIWVMTLPTPSRLLHATYSPDGSKIAAYTVNHVVWVLDATNGTHISELRGHTGLLRRVLFSPDGTRVITIAVDATLRIWDTESGAEFLTLPGRWLAAISHDGSRIVTGGIDLKTAIVYDSRPVNRAFIRLPVAPPPRPADR